jgi:hypothetical protein
MVLAALVAALGWAAARARWRHGAPDAGLKADGPPEPDHGQIPQLAAEGVAAGQGAVAHER